MVLTLASSASAWQGTGPADSKSSSPEASQSIPAALPQTTLRHRGGIRASAWQVLGQGLNDKKALNRIATLTAMSDLGKMSAGVRLAVARLQHDKDADVRKYAALTLAEMKSRLAIPPLRAALRDDNAGVSFAAAQALWQLGDHSGHEILLQVLEGQRPASDNIIHSSVRDMQHKLQNPKGLVTMGAEKGAGALLGPFSFGIPVAKQFLAEPANSERALTVHLLARDPDHQTIQVLKAALWDKDWSVRQASARAAGALKRREFLPLLSVLLDDDKPAVRSAAAVAIIRITGSAQPAAARPVVSAQAR